MKFILTTVIESLLLCIAKDMEWARQVLPSKVYNDKEDEEVYSRENKISIARKENFKGEKKMSFLEDSGKVDSARKYFIWTLIDR